MAAEIARATSFRKKKGEIKKKYGRSPRKVVLVSRSPIFFFFNPADAVFFSPELLRFDGWALPRLRKPPFPQASFIYLAARAHERSQSRETYKLNKLEHTHTHAKYSGERAAYGIERGLAHKHRNGRQSFRMKQRRTPLRLCVATTMSIGQVMSYEFARDREREGEGVRTVS